MTGKFACAGAADSGRRAGSDVGRAIGDAIGGERGGNIGGAIGGLAAYLAFDGYQTATMNWQSFSQVAFAFAVTPSLLGQALAYATIMGMLGGLLPAWKAARMPVVTALREL